MVEEPSGPVRLDGATLSLDKVLAVARRGATVEISDEVREKVAKARASLERLLSDGATVYAVNTGVGDLVDVRIPKDDLKALQVNLLRSHACAVGDPLPPEVVRAMMLLRANALAKGFSAIRPCIIDMLVSMLTRTSIPSCLVRGLWARAETWHCWLILPLYLSERDRLRAALRCFLGQRRLGERRSPLLNWSRKRRYPS